MVPGWDAAGVVEGVGPAVRDFAEGDRVYAYCRKHFVGEGTYAERVAVPEDFVAPAPRSLDALHAGALPLIADPLQDERYRARGIAPTYVFVRPSGAQLAELGRLADDGVLRVHLERTFPLAEAAAAHELLEEGHATGKIVLDVGA